MEKMKKIILFFTACMLSLPGFAQNSSDIYPKNLDRNYRPQDDFAKFTNGGWQKLHPLPANYGRYTTFDMLQDENSQRINDILIALSKKKLAKGTIEQKMNDFYQSALNMDSRNKAGITPVQPIINEIVSAKTIDDLRQLQIKYAMDGYGQPYYTYFDADDKNVSKNILKIGQAGLTLQQRDYYLNNDSATTAIRTAYKKHIVRMFNLYGFNDTDANKYADDVYRQETILALVSKSNTELRNPQANYNKMSLHEFNAKYPNIPLEATLNAEGVSSSYIQEMIVGQPDFFSALDHLLELQTADELRAVMLWSLINSSAKYLTDDIRQANFDFFGKTISGRKEDDPLWKRAEIQTEDFMGEAMGRLYCQKYFPESSKKMMEQLVKNLQISLAQRIDAQTWMSDSTKANAKRKLNKFYVKIGYPNKWKDYAALTIDPSKSYYENVVAARHYEISDEIARKAGKPVDRDEWGMYPQTVNAYYNPTTNEICFPAGILQYPFFDPKADAAFNYGAIGVVIGHEMTHGFDDEGSQYDADGYLRNWWTTSDGANFKKRTELYAKWYDSIELLPGLHANGHFTNGENLADHGGLMVSYNAYKNITASHPLPKKAGFTADQRFFLAFAGIYANNITDAELRNRVKIDPHSQGRWRIMGSLPHIDAWYKAFDVKEGDKMFIPKNKRLELW